jgi:hypothetical protein
MNEHILLVMKWLKNPESVTQEELDANFESARSAAASRANSAAADAAYYAVAARADDYDYDYDVAVAAASFWVDEYFKITGEDKQTYIDALNLHTPIKSNNQSIQDIIDYLNETGQRANLSVVKILLDNILSNNI